MRLRIEGPQFVWHSLAHVNREVGLALLGSGKAELSLWPTEPEVFSAAEEPRFAPLAERVFAPLSGPAAVHVRHGFPPRLLPPPQEGRSVLRRHFSSTRSSSLTIIVNEIRGLSRRDSPRRHGDTEGFTERERAEGAVGRSGVRAFGPSGRDPLSPLLSVPVVPF